MICKKCGAQIDDNLTECNFCGAVLKESSEDEETKVIDTDAVNEAIEDKENEAEEEVSDFDQTDETESILDENEINRRLQLNRLKAEKQQQLDEIEKRRNEKKKKQKRNRIVAILIIVIALGAIGGGVYYLSQGGSETEVVVATETPTKAPLPTVVPEETEAPEEATEEAPTWVPAGGTGSTSASGGTSSNGSAQGTSGSGAPASAGTGRTQAASSNTGGTTSSNTTASGSTGSAAQGNTAANNAAPAAAPAKDYSNTPVGADGYVFGDSSSRLLTEADLAGKSADELRIARNEIYARHGRKFKDASLQNYFSKCAWYSINDSYNYSDDAANLNSIEQANAKFILQYEKSH